jgi:hypothetical protein
MHALDGWDGWGLNGLNQTLHVRNGSAGTSCRLSAFLGSIRCWKMSTFTLSRYGEAAVVSLVPTKRLRWRGVSRVVALNLGASAVFQPI